jgi:hypothetical protein
MFLHIPHYPVLANMAHNDVMFIAASMMAVCGFLRGGEFLAYAGSGRPFLRHQDVRVTSEGGEPVVMISIQRPKNMQWALTAEVRCFNPRGSMPFDLIAAITAYRKSAVAIRAGFVFSPRGPAFIMLDGRPLSRVFMVQRTEELVRLAGIQVVNQEGIAAPVKAASWRAGGVKSALDACIPVPTIMAMGRWRSIAWHQYTSQSVTDLRRAQAAMWRPIEDGHSHSVLRVGDHQPASIFALADEFACP